MPLKWKITIHESQTLCQTYTIEWMIFMTRYLEIFVCILLIKAARAISAFWKTHSRKLIPNWTRKTVWLPMLSRWEVLTPPGRTLVHRRLATSRRWCPLCQPRTMENWVSFGEKSLKETLSSDTKSHPHVFNQRKLWMSRGYIKLEIFCK